MLAAIQQVQQTPQTPNQGAATNGGFLDFIVAIGAMFMMLQSHKLTRSFLDAIWPNPPGGGRVSGPGGVMKGMMAGIGMTMSRKLINGGINAAKTGVGVAATGGVGGLAGGMKYAKSSDLLGGFLGSGGKGSGGLGNLWQGLGGGKPPGGSGGGEGGATPLLEGSKQSLSGLGEFVGFAREAETAAAAGFAAESLFDSGSTSSGTALALKPSSATKLGLKNGGNSAHEQKKSLGGLLGAIGTGAAEGIGRNALHKMTGNRGFVASDGSGSRNLLGHTIAEFGTVADQTAAQEVSRNSFLPSTELVNAATTNPLAKQDMQKIGQYQHEIDAGQNQLEQAVALQETIRPQYESAFADYQSAENDLNGLEIFKTGYESNGMTNTPEYQQVVANHQVAIERYQAAKTNYETQRGQMERSENMIRTGEARKNTAMNNISKINQNWMPGYKQKNKRFIEAAQAHANRPTLSDLSKPNPYASQKKKK